MFINFLLFSNLALQTDKSTCRECANGGAHYLHGGAHFIRSTTDYETGTTRKQQVQKYVETTDKPIK